MSFAKHPSFELVAVADVDLARFEPAPAALPQGARLSGLARAAREGAQEHRLGERLDPRSHALPRRARSDEARQGRSTSRSRSATRFTKRGADRGRAAQHGLTTQMGIQVSSTRPQRYGEALVRSGIVGKIREVHTFSNKSWGDDKPLPEAIDPVPAPLDWDGWLGVSAPRPFKRGVYHPGEWRRRIGFGTGTLGDMGCHIYSPPYRALKLTSPVSVTADGPAPTAESWAIKARVKLTYPGTEYTAGRDGGRLVVRRRRAAARRRFASRSAPGCRSRAAWSSAPTG